MHYKVDFKPDVVIYHDPCVDGLTAAYAVWLKYREEVDTIEFVPGNLSVGRDDAEYWDALVKDKKVVILDFSFDRETTLRLHELSDTLIVLDHHKTAEETLGDLEFCHFRQDISGALMSWQAFHPGPPPKLFKYVSDRDLWKWDMELSKPINAYIMSQKRTLYNWKALENYLEDEKLSIIALKGRAMETHADSMVDSIIRNAEMWDVKGVEVLAVNSPELQSEICHKLLSLPECKGVAGCYSIKNGLVRWSLRGTGEVDMSKVAEKFKGGGGHVKAAGFTVTIDDGQINFTGKKIG